ncbi:protein NRT1/ PTR FAMILY 4.2 [Senna tora]|uniref:Protein NRT1/ PTR FAMILY 4.2 n=1 Tax=Senna tora TaxID=362788 RepID=A0A834XKP3_9FABA|nr:protein NRT1/ PTR FAMILY 4.2 [Senna tora]
MIASMQMRGRRSEPSPTESTAAIRAFDGGDESVWVVVWMTWRQTDDMWHLMDRMAAITMAFYCERDHVILALLFGDNFSALQENLHLIHEESRGSDVYMEYKGRKADPRKHGGIRAGCFVLVVEVLENMVFLSIATNLVSYFVKSMHYSAAKSSNMIHHFPHLAATLMVWLQDTRGWNLSFMISAFVLAFALCIFTLPFPFYRYKCPAGSPLTRIIKVFASSAHNWKASYHNDRAISGEQSHDKFNTIMMNCCLAQLQTFTVEQGSIMNRKLDNFTIPTQSLSLLPLLIMLASIPFFEHIKHLTNTNMFQPLARIGAVAAIVEAKRRKEANKNESVTVSVFWLGWQFLTHLLWEECLSFSIQRHLMA